MKRGQKTGAEQVVLKLRQIEVQTAQVQKFGDSVQRGGDLRAERLIAGARNTAACRSTKTVG